MNAIERRNRRVGRLVIITEINEIEQTYCHVCPNRKSKDLSACKACPIAVRLNDLGKQLSGMSDRTNAEKIIEEPNVKYESKLRVDPAYHFARGKMRMRREPLTRDEIISGVAEHGTVSALARVLGIPETTVRYRAYAYELAGIKGKQAKELLRMKEGDGNY